MNKLVILFLVFAILGSIEAYRKVALETIPYLDLYRGRYTTGYKPVAQLTCYEDGAGLCNNYAASYVHCDNVGSNRGQVIWRCQATLRNGVTLGSINVSCETYPGTQPYQGYVIDGSCGLRYTLRRG